MISNLTYKPGPLKGICLPCSCQVNQLDKSSGGLPMSLHVRRKFPVDFFDHDFPKFLEGTAQQTTK